MKARTTNDLRKSLCHLDFQNTVTESIAHGETMIEEYSRASKAEKRSGSTRCAMLTRTKARRATVVKPRDRAAYASVPSASDCTNPAIDCESVVEVERRVEISSAMIWRGVESVTPRMRDKAWVMANLIEFSTRNCRVVLRAGYFFGPNR